jgi:uncharacterized membrane protein YadS
MCLSLLVMPTAICGAMAAMAKNGAAAENEMMTTTAPATIT